MKLYVAKCSTVVLGVDFLNRILIPFFIKTFVGGLSPHAINL